jgi:hypothetical protein
MIRQQEYFHQLSEQFNAVQEQQDALFKERLDKEIEEAEGQL